MLMLFQKVIAEKTKYTDFHIRWHFVDYIFLCMYMHINTALFNETGFVSIRSCMMVCVFSNPLNINF